MENNIGYAKRTRISAKRRKLAQRQGMSRFQIKILICAGVFLLAFAVKMAMPELQGKIKAAFLPVLSESVDYKGAISSIGEAIAGEKTVSEALGEFYILAFEINSPEEDIEAAAASEGIEASEDEPEEGVSRTAVVGAEMQNMRDMASKRKETILILDNQETEAEPEEAEDASAAIISAFLEGQAQYSDYALPERVSYEMPGISFEYTYPAIAEITSGFGYREHPTEGGVKFHYGIDIAANLGEDVLAFADGMVVSTGESTALGYYVIIKHGDGYESQYAHCSAIYVSSGQEVSKGDVIAAVGGTGNVTGVHLHFELSHDDVFINPEYYLYY